MNREMKNVNGLVLLRTRQQDKKDSRSYLLTQFMFQCQNMGYRMNVATFSPQMSSYNDGCVTDKHVPTAA